MGWRRDTMLRSSEGKRIWMMRVTAGQAEEIRGRGRLRSLSISRSAWVTMSAPRATSNTSLKPSALSASSICPTLWVRRLNWAKKEGAGRATRCLN